MKEIKAGVPQGSVLGSILYLLYTNDLPEANAVTKATFADNKVLMATGTKDAEISTNKVRTATNKLVNWAEKWKFKLNEVKSVYIDFTNEKLRNPQILNINRKTISCKKHVKYFGMNLNVRLKWNYHIKKKKGVRSQTIWVNNSMMALRKKLSTKSW